MTTPTTPTRVLHSVYFALGDPSPERTADLVSACHKYLNCQPGILFFAAGPLAAGLDRPVNDRDWQVALHILFIDMAAHDQYQTDPTHLQFIAEQKQHWAKVRVFDALV